MPWVAAAAGAAVSLYEGEKGAGAAEDAGNKSSDASKYSANIQKQEYDQTRQDQMPWLQSGTSALSRLNYLMGAGGGTKTKQQLIQELTPQFTKMPNGGTVPAGALGMYMGGNGVNGFGYPTGTSAFGGATVDQTGLSAAVDAALKKQAATQAATSADPAYGSLSRNFSQTDLNTDPVYQNGLQFGLSEGEKGINNMAAANGSMLSGATLKALTRYGNDYGTTKAQGAYDRFNSNQTNQYNRLGSLADVGQTAANTLGKAGANYADSIGGLSMVNAVTQGNALLAGAQARGSGYQGAANALGRVDWSKMFSSNNSGTPSNEYF